MEKYTLKVGEITSEIKIGYNILEDILSSKDLRKCFFVIDKFIYEKFSNYYFEFIKKNLHEYNIYLLDSIEENKKIDSAIDIVRKLNSGNYLRDAIIIGIGGGIIGDIVGFVSSIYMRGIEFINVPTTLLAQVDSSIGGKNALNVDNGKNLIGTFNYPKEVIIDIKFLETITKRELISGLAEVIKYGIVFHWEFLNYIKENLNSIFQLNKDVLKEIICKSCCYKISVVEKDAQDFSVRKFLNFGHTIGHAIESVTDYKVYTHGESVLIGIFYESCIAFELNLIDKYYFEYICEFIKSFNIVFDNKLLLKDSFYEALLRDKKNKDDRISFILPIGKSKVCERLLSLNEVKILNYSKYCF